MGNRKSRLKSPNTTKIIYQSRKTIISEGTWYGKKVIFKEKNPEYAKKGATEFLIREEYEKIKLLQPHPNIVRTFGLEDSRIILSKYECNLLELHTSSIKPSIEQILKICVDVMRGLSHIHQNGIIHRDLKPENILIDRDHYVICDFDTSAYIKNFTYDITCTYVYVAPEVIDGNIYDKMVDYWSLGAILFELETGKTFRIMESVNIYRSLFFVRTELVPIIRDLLSIQPWKRPTIWELHRYPIFNSYLDSKSNS